MVLELTAAELCSTVDALRSAICVRIRLAIQVSPFRDPVLPDAQEVFDTMVGAYSKAMMDATENEVISRAFIRHFTLTDEMWDVINEISLIKDWDELTVHKHPWESCVLCTTLQTIQ